MEVTDVVKVIGGGVVLLHAGVLLSVPYVLLGRGAPYLPTFAKPMQRMFQDLLPKHIHRVPNANANANARKNLNNLRRRGMESAISQQQQPSGAGIRNGNGNAFGSASVGDLTLVDLC